MSATISAAGRAVGLLRRGPRLNPLQALASVAARNPRAATVVGGAAAIGFGATALLAISSVQAFLVISGQSSIMADQQAAALLERPSGSDVVDVAATGAALLTGPAQLFQAGSSTGSGSPGASPASATAAQGHPTAPVTLSETVSVDGIRVHTSIADDLRGLLDAAAADGIALSGWGWRDSQAQIRLRRQHCGTTEYAIYQMPSSQCRPPTARPGSSQHERGLAIDFTYNGGSIGTRNSPGFQWLAANAARFGFRNLASEPWHWSTTGR